MSAPRIVNIGLVQLAMDDAPAANMASAMAAVRAAAAQGAQIICLPELFRSRYFCQSEEHVNFALAEPVPGPSTEILCALARELGVVIIASLFEKRAEGLYHNTAAVIDADGSYLGKYRKMHIPDDPLFYEKFYFTPGDLGFKVFPTRFGRVGVLICWDQWYPEAARLTALRGADLLFYPTAIGWHPAEKAEYGLAQHQSWETIQRSHGVANGCYVVSVNRTGHEGDPAGGIEFWGQSFLSDPSGTILAKAPVDHAAILVAPVDLARLDVQRTHWPFLRDRRIDAYGEITKRYIDDM
ncbi:carbon-nitrogen hydrolase [Oscillochloris sp. ZM17-4]|uniref:carbon-nitrogen hydrolase n=1 Tax=Oscillochloris sp. ZM17-4 TaxID=2866714 RepID=UPI001C73985D|nr:carbon-nitrogen hydrolase [Oscillochloris sp. ZM17-4]MBX0326520.1 carbon-nitrogen hydrolase [Oscillochloris sp. ZM17-4]